MMKRENPQAANAFSDDFEARFSQLDLPSLSDAFPNIPSDTLFHYCSAGTFLSIASNPSIRASDINKMNDHLEFEWGLACLSDAIKICSNKSNENFFQKLHARVEECRQTSLPIIACFSTEPDVLSQWRAYSDDGAGFSVGFSLDSVMSMPGNIYPVIYDKGKQIDYLKGYLYDAFNKYLKHGDEKKDFFVFMAGSFLYGDLCFYKNPAFSEEKEVRLMYLYVVHEEDGCLIVSDPEEEDPKPLNYFVRSGSLVGYCDFPALGERSIRTVYLGPRNPNNVREIQCVLSSKQVANAKVIKSQASYRR